MPRKDRKGLKQDAGGKRLAVFVQVTPDQFAWIESKVRPALGVTRGHVLRALIENERERETKAKAAGESPEQIFVGGGLRKLQLSQPRAALRQPALAGAGA